MNGLFYFVEILLINISKDDITLIIAIIGCILGIFKFYFSIKKYEMEKPNIEVLNVDVRYSIKHINLIKKECLLIGTIYYEVYNKSTVCPICIKNIIGYFKKQQNDDCCSYLKVKPKVIQSGEYIKNRDIFDQRYIKFYENDLENYFTIYIPEDFIIDCVEIDYDYGVTKKSNWNIDINL